MKSLKSYFYRVGPWVDWCFDVTYFNDALNNGFLDAVACGDAERVKLLLEAGADVHARNDVALRSAAFKGYTEMAEILLEAGADVHANGGEALGVAEYFERTETASLLKEWMARKDRPPEAGGTGAAGPEIHRR